MMLLFRLNFWLFFLCRLCESGWFGRRINHLAVTSALSRSRLGLERKILSQVSRGGATTTEEDEERYSRQVYTLGARAHGLIRSSTVYLDGPHSSGLVYECAKNLALSGIRRIIVVRDDDGNEELEQLCRNYHNEALDDLGAAYVRAARSELEDDDESLSAAELLVAYLQRLNPNVAVSLVDRSSLGDQAAAHDEDEEGQTRRVVLLSVDRPYPALVDLNQLSRKKNWAFVAVETAGVFGRVFCDFGDSFEVFDSDGETPAVTPLNLIEPDPDGGDPSCIIVHSIEGEKHDVSKGDTIQFQFRDGSFSAEQCIVTFVYSPFRFTAKIASSSAGEDLYVDDFVNKINKEAASFQRIKVPQELKFQSIEAAIGSAKMDGSLYASCDLEKSFDVARRTATMSCFQALASFVQKEKRSPTLDDKVRFRKLAKDARGGENINTREAKKHSRSFLRTCAAKFTPLQAVFGAIGAQEALKATTGVYYPVHQFLLYDCDEVLREGKGGQQATINEQETCPSSGLMYILGVDTVSKLMAHRVFVVGAGAIGCEILKNLAAMGVCTAEKGKLILTDMDSIEKSNLSRQLLFRDTDIGKFKSTAAQEAVLRFNPSMKVEAHSSKVGSADHNPFDDKFWSRKCDTVLNALDNVEARLYIDGQCVQNQKALVDAGTMGPKGNVQVVVPHLTESYSSSADPPEPSIAVCTLKNFPYAISHTIQWGRDLFEGLFERRPEQASDFVDYMSSGNIEEFAVKLVQEKGDEMAIETADELCEDVSALATAAQTDFQSVKSAALQWSSELAFKLFYATSKELMQKHPLGSKDEDGEPFWSGTRRPPKALAFSDSSFDDPEQATLNSNLIEFVRNAARLRLESMLNPKELKAGQSRCTDAEAERAIVALYREHESSSSSAGHGATKNDMNTVTDQVLARLSEVAIPQRKMVPVEFEKDDESNGHVAFVAAASNLRAICYGIPPVDAMETRRVAGKIVPAMITTTAFVSALSCVELVKLVQEANLRAHRNSFINLALPFFAFTQPLPAEHVQGLRGKSYTLWDRLSIKEGKKAAAKGGITMRSLLRRIKKQACDEPEVVEVSSISVGPYMLFASFLHEEDDRLLNTSLWELVDEAVASGEAFENDFSRRGDDAGPAFVKHDSYVDLGVVVSDLETGEEVELPPIRVERFIT